MDERRRKRGWRYWCTAIAVLMPVVYLAVLGILTWLGVHFDYFSNNDMFWACYNVYVFPAQWLKDNGPESVRRALNWYLGLFVRL
jgi:hypothetical protein